MIKYVICRRFVQPGHEVINCGSQIDKGTMLSAAALRMFLHLCCMQLLLNLGYYCFRLLKSCLFSSVYKYGLQSWIPVAQQTKPHVALNQFLTLETRQDQSSAVAWLCNSVSHTGQAHLGSCTVAQLCISHWTSMSRRWHGCATLHLTLDKHISAVARLRNSASDTGQAHLGSLLLLVCVSFTIIGQPRNSVLIRRV